jgi:hypothetical protein
MSELHIECLHGFFASTSLLLRDPHLPELKGICASSGPLPPGRRTIIDALEIPIGLEALSTLSFPCAEWDEEQTNEPRRDIVEIIQQRLSACDFFSRIGSTKVIVTRVDSGMRVHIFMGRFLLGGDGFPKPY